MNPRITAFLLLVAVAFGAFIYFYEIRGKEAREQAEKEPQKIFVGVTKEGIEKISLTTSDGASVTLERVEGRWRIVAPLNFPADEITVESMLSALVSAAKESVLQDVQALELYGLDASAKEIRFVVQGVEHRVRIGRETKLGGSKYVMVESAQEVTTLPTYVLSTFEHSLDELRDKRVLYFDQAAVKQIRLRWIDGAEGVLLDKQDGAWRLREPIQESADSDTVETLLSDLYFIRAQSFVDAPSAAQRQDLAKPALQIELMTQNEVGEQKTFELAFAKQASGEARLVQRGAEGFYQVSSEVFDSIPQDVAAYRDKRLGDFDPESATALTITFRELGKDPIVVQAALAPEAATKRKLAAEEGESDAEEFHDARDWVTTPTAMDPMRVDDLVLELSHLRASSIVADVMGAETLTAFGLNPVRVEIEIFGGDQEARAPLGHFLFGTADVETGIVAKLLDSEIVYRIPFGLARAIPLTFDSLQEEGAAEEDLSESDE